MIRVDYAGPGGVCEGLRLIGAPDVVGIEWDAAACATRAAAGHLTIRADLATYRPHHAPGSVEGYLASPPCQTFSTAGKGDGRDQLDALAHAILAEDWAAADRFDPRTRHVIDAARTAIELHPEWIGMERIARAEVLKLKEQEFVLASRTLGARPMFIIFNEILPNTIGQIITQLMFSIPTAIFTEAFLSFVGLGIPVPMCSLGSLISDAFNSFTTHPYQILPPIIVLATLMLCFNMLADGLREAFDPKLKEM